MSNKESPSVSYWISLGRENIIDLGGRLRVGGNGNRRDPVKGEVNEVFTGREDQNWGTFGGYVKT